MEIAFTQTPNFTKGTGIKKIGFVLHGTLGAYKGAVEWLMTPASQRKDKTQSSAHYVIGRNEGEVTQLVKNEDIAWHAGILSHPVARAAKVLPKNADCSFKNPNQFFVGIEFAWGYDTDKDGDVDAQDRTLTEWQYKCACEIIKSSGFYNPDTLLSHKELTDFKSDDMLFAVNEINRRLAPNPNAAIVKEIEDKLLEIQSLVTRIVV